jgi:hypothetical protein
MTIEYGEIPEAFQCVDLRDRNTFSRVTFREWIYLRGELVEVQKQHQDYRQEYIEARTKAKLQLWREKGLSRKRNEPELQGELLARFKEILQSSFHEKVSRPKPLSGWQLEFLKESKWIDEFFAAYNKGFGRRTLVGLLGEWIVDVEDENEVAQNRQKAREKHFDSVSTFRSVSMPNRKNPFLPEPVELIGIYRAVLIVIERIRKNHSRAGKDPRHPPNVTFELQSVVRQLRRLNYLTYLDQDEAIAWTGWQKILHAPRAKLAKEFLGALFRASPRTIKRDLSRSSLEPQYIGLPKRYHVFCDGSKQLGAARVFEKGWYLRPDDLEPVESVEHCAFFPPS